MFNINAFGFLDQFKFSCSCTFSVVDKWFANFTVVVQKKPVVNISINNCLPRRVTLSNTMIFASAAGLLN